MKKTLIICTIVLIGLFAIMFWGKTNNATKTSWNPGTIDFLVSSEKLYDFGTISMKSGLVEHIFKVTNPTNKDVFIKKINTSCMCTKAYTTSVNGEKGPFSMEGMGGITPLANETIKAGGSLDVKVVYDPNAHGPAGVGVINRFVYLADLSGRVFQLEIKAVVTP